MARLDRAPVGRSLGHRVRRAEVLRFDRGREPVPAPRDGRDRLRPEHLAQGRDLHLQVVLLHDHVGPDEIDELGLPDDAVATLDQCQQQVERAGAERRGDAVDQHLPLAGADLEAAETIAVGHGPLAFGGRRRSAAGSKPAPEPLFATGIRET
jgi:hypothetical protein